MDVVFDFTGQSFVVTGASSGIGKEAALELLQAGASVLGLARTMSAKLEDFAVYGERFCGVDVDVTDEKALGAAISEFTAVHGKLSGTVHSAGAAKMLPLQVFNLTQAEAMMRLNLWAGMSLVKLASKKKHSVEGASHVFISSVSAKKGQAGLAVYSATKGALEAMVRSAAVELAGKKQRVNSVCLGWVDTPMTREQGGDNVVLQAPFGIGKTADVTGMILFLLSSRAGWISGSDFVLDGGYLA